jgi:hypothetical protein
MTSDDSQSLGARFGAVAPALPHVLAEMARQHCREITDHAVKVASAVALGRQMAHIDPHHLTKTARTGAVTGLLRRGGRELGEAATHAAGARGYEQALSQAAKQLDELGDVGNAEAMRALLGKVRAGQSMPANPTQQIGAIHDAVARRQAAVAGGGQRLSLEAAQPSIAKMKRPASVQRPARTAADSPAAMRTAGPVRRPVQSEPTTPSMIAAVGGRPQVAPRPAGPAPRQVAPRSSWVAPAVAGTGVAVGTGGVAYGASRPQPPAIPKIGHLVDLETLSKEGGLIGGAVGAAKLLGRAAVGATRLGGKAAIGTGKLALKYPKAALGVGAVGVGAPTVLGGMKLHERHQQRQHQAWRHGMGSPQSYWQSRQM